MNRTPTIVSLLAIFTFSPGCQQTQPPSSNIEITPETVVSGAEQPVDLAFAPDGRVFYTEKETGRIRIIKNGSLLESPFATLPVNNFSERGLLGIALHPDFATNHFLYVFFSRSTTNAVSGSPPEIDENRVVRFNADDDIPHSEPVTIVSLPAQGPGIHNGGAIRFGPDGNLYIATGDLANDDNAQNLTALPGKILRYGDDGAILAGNPFDADSPVFAMGIRNTFGLAFDASGRLFGNENGSFNHDEINLIESGGNYGWPSVQGEADDALGDPIGETSFASSNANYHDPIVDKSDGSVGAAGIAVIPDETYGAGLTGRILYGEYSNRRIMMIEVDADGHLVGEKSVFIDGLPARIRGMAFAPDGILWLAAENAIIRLLPGSNSAQIRR